MSGTLNESMLDAIVGKYAAPFKSLSGVAPAWIAEVTATDWTRIAQLVRAEGGRLVAIWGSDRQTPDDQFVVSVCLCATDGLLWLRLAVSEIDGYPDLSAVYPAASRMQRALFDLLGIQANRAEDTRPWLNHGRWPAAHFPLRHEHDGKQSFDTPLENYPFVQVAGDGVHEIAVGPIHAGIIEPGHFRFSVVGEKVLRLEQRLGYTHKGTERLFVQRDLAQGQQLAGRISGDSTVAYAWAYCMAAEAASGCTIPERARWLRALMLERERIANHLGDLGAIANDAGLAVALAQFTLLKEDWVRLNDRLFGHRFMMDRIVAGGVAVDLDADGIALLLTQCEQVLVQVRAMQDIYDGHAGLQDRFIGAGRVAPKLASELGLCGMPGRASGQVWDARVDQACAPYVGSPGTELEFAL